jgi:hypothetical protein
VLLNRSALNVMTSPLKTNATDSGPKEGRVAIGNAVQRGAWVYVYDEKGWMLCTLAAGGKPPDGLKGYTGSTVSLRKGGWVYTYNEMGRSLSTAPAT